MRTLPSRVKRPISILPNKIKNYKLMRQNQDSIRCQSLVRHVWMKLIILFKKHIILSSNVNNKSNVISQAWCGIKNWINVLRALHQCYGYNKKMISHQNNKRPQNVCNVCVYSVKIFLKQHTQRKTLYNGVRYTL